MYFRKLFVAAGVWLVVMACLRTSSGDYDVMYPIQDEKIAVTADFGSNGTYSGTYSQSLVTVRLRYKDGSDWVTAQTRQTGSDGMSQWNTTSNFTPPWDPLFQANVWWPWGDWRVDVINLGNGSPVDFRIED